MTEEVKKEAHRAGYVVTVTLFVPAHTNDLSSMTKAQEQINRLQHKDFWKDAAPIEVEGMKFKHVKRQRTGTSE